MVVYLKYFIYYAFLWSGLAVYPQSNIPGKQWEEAIKSLKKIHPYTGTRYEPGKSMAALCILSDSTIVDTCFIELTYQAEIQLDSLGVRKTVDITVVRRGRRFQKFNSRICLQRLINYTLFTRNEEDKQIGTPSQYQTAIDYAIFRDLAEAKVVNRHLLPKMSNRIFEYEEPLPQFEWKIDTAKRTLAGYVCHKAQTSYAGRDWIVWFAPEIPFDAAPWKFNGLPGAVLEAYDTNRHFHFSISGIEQVEQPIVRYEIPTKKMSRKAFRTLEQKVYRHPFNSPSDFLIVPNLEINEPQFLPDDWMIPYNPIELE